MNNLPRLWRSELDSVLQAEASTRSPADRREAFADIASSMRRNAKLVAALRAEGRHLLDARAAVVQAVEVLAVRFPDLEAEEAFLSAIATAFTWCLDLELRGESRDTGKKTGVAVQREDLNKQFCEYMAKKRKRVGSSDTEARKWLFENGKIKSDIQKELADDDKKKVRRIAKSWRHYLKTRDAK